MRQHWNRIPHIVWLVECGYFNPHYLYTYPFWLKTITFQMPKGRCQLFLLPLIESEPQLAVLKLAVSYFHMLWSTDVTRWDQTPESDVWKPEWWGCCIPEPLRRKFHTSLLSQFIQLLLLLFCFVLFCFLSTVLFKCKEVCVMNSESDIWFWIWLILICWLTLNTKQLII